MTKITLEQFSAIARERVPLVASLGVVIEAIGDGTATARAPYREDFLRPGGTISGPVMMAVADIAMYGAVLSKIGDVQLAVTTNLNINFLRRPEPGDIVGHASLLKLGKKLAVGEVHIYGADPDQLVAHVTSTYSIPPSQDN